MRRLLPPLAAAMLLLTALPAAAQEAWPRTAHIIVPQRRGYAPVQRTAVRMPAVQVSLVEARIAVLGQTATTELDVHLRNPGRRPAEAVLLLPVPDGAVVHHFDFLGKGAEPSARVLPRDEARGKYNAIVSRLRDPALLEFAGYALLRSSVFPVPARGVQRLKISYHHILGRDGNRTDYILPRSEDADIATPWRITVDIKAKNAISTVYSPSHDLALKRHADRHVALTVTRRAGREPGAFRFSYLTAGGGPDATLFAYPDPKTGGGYFLLLAGVPPQPPRNVRREVSIVLDRSGSMAGPKMDQVRAAALQIIEGLVPGEAFNILDYSHTVARFAKAPVPNTRENILAARKYLAALRPGGGTNIHDALVEALRQPATPNMLPLVLFLTDGLPTIGDTSEVSIRDVAQKGNRHQRRVFTFGVGTDVNVPLLDRVAEITRGTATYAVPTEDVELKIAQVFRRLSGPVLANPTLVNLDKGGVETTRAVRDLIPAALPDLFDGDQLVVLGRYLGEEPLHFELSGLWGGDPRRFQYRFAVKNATTRNAFVPRLWASRRIGELIDQLRQAGALRGGRPSLQGESLLTDPRHREVANEILRLSTQFGILTEYTAFLATEGTDLAKWSALVAVCGLNLDQNAVQTRAGLHAVTQGRNIDSAKRQSRMNARNAYIDDKLRRIEVSAAVQQSNDRGFFKRGNRWIDGNLVARKSNLLADEVITWGTKRHAALVDALVAEGRQSLLARTGEILLARDGKTILVKNTIPNAQPATENQK